MSKKSIVRISAIILLLSLAAISLCSCSFPSLFEFLNRGNRNVSDEDGDMDTDTDTDTDTDSDSDSDTDSELEHEVKTSKEYIDSMPGFDFGGSGVIIATSEDCVYFNMNDRMKAQYDSIVSAIEKKFDTLVVYEKSSTFEELFSSVKKAVDEGGYYADFVCVPLSESAKYSSGGLSVSPNELFYYNTLSASHIMTIQDAVVSDAAFPALSSVVVFCNTELLSAIGAPDLYNECRNGNWNYSKMLEICNLAHEKGVTSISTSLSAELCSGILYSMLGKDLLSLDRNGNAVTFSNDKDEMLVQMVAYLVGSENGESAEQVLFGGFTEQEGRNSFYSGKSLFYIADLSEAEKIYNSKCSWSILPLPKSSSSSSYTTALDPYNTWVMIPLRTRDRQKAQGIFLQAFSLASQGVDYGAVRPWLYSECLRESRSLYSLEYIFDNKAIFCDKAGAYIANEAMYAQTYKALYDAVSAKAKELFAK